MFIVKRKSIANLPTPLQYLSNLSKKLGVKVFCKRDDMTGDIAFYGNKVRKLEYILTEAKNEKTDTIIVTGGIQSNMVRAACALAARFNMRAVAVLSGSMPKNKKANLFMDALFGAKMYYLSETEDANLFMAKICEELKEMGKRPYVIPLGASNGLGTLGYVHAHEEMRKQALKKKVEFSWEFVTLGSGGTMAGVVLGAGLDKKSESTKLVGVSVSQKETTARARAVNCIEEAKKYFTDEYKNKIADKAFMVEENFIGAGYGEKTNECLAAIKLLAETEGIILDHVYTGKAFACMLSYIEKKIIKKGENVLFWHTGGGTGLLAKSYEELW